MFLKSLLVLALGTALPALAESKAVFQVHNLTPHPCEVVDRTGAGPETGFRLDLLRPGGAGGGAPGRWRIEPKASLTFRASTCSDTLTGARIEILGGPAGARVGEVPVPFTERALKGAWAGIPKVRPCDLWIEGGDWPRVRMGPAGATEPVPVESKAMPKRRREAPSPSESGGEDGGTPRPGPDKVLRPDRSTGTAACLLVENRSAATWTLHLEWKGAMPRLSTWPLGPGGESYAKHVMPMKRAKPQRGLLDWWVRIRAGHALALWPTGAGELGPTEFQGRLYDAARTNPYRSWIECVLEPGAKPELDYVKSPGPGQKAVLPGLSGHRLIIPMDAWPRPVPPEMDLPALPSKPEVRVPPAPPAEARPDAAGPGEDVPDARPGPGTGLSVLAGRGGVEVPPVHPEPDPAGADPLASPAPLSPQAWLERAVPTLWIQAVRQDLARSPMFLGFDEGQALAHRLGLSVDVFLNPIGSVDDPSTDAWGRLRLEALNRFGTESVPAPDPDGLLLLHRNLHYTLLRPAAPGEAGEFVAGDGTPYVEVRRSPGPSGASGAPLIAADGHCLVSSLHFLKHRTLPTEEQIWAHRAQVALDLPPGRLARLAVEMAAEVLGACHPWLPAGHFATLGPAFSAALSGDPTFMGFYAKALEDQKQLVESWILDSGTPKTMAPGPFDPTPAGPADPLPLHPAHPVPPR